MKLKRLVTTAMLALMGSPAVALEAGGEAPDFRAPSTAGEIHLASYRGEKAVLLALYYADFTPV